MAEQQNTTTPAKETTAGTEVAKDTAGAKDAKTPPLSSFFSGPLFWVLIGVWLLVLWNGRKQKKKQTERQQELEALKKGDKVITIGRVHGEVVALDKETMTLKTDSKSGASITFDRSAIFKIVGKDKAENKE